MKKPPPLALICAGSIGDSPVAKIRNLAEHLGAVKSSAVRVASRVANILRAGQAVSTYEELNSSRIILISVPDAAIEATQAEMLGSGVSWSGRIIVLASNRMGCTELARLAAAGAYTGSLALVPGFEESWFLLEGDRVVQVNLRPLLASRGVRVTMLLPLRRAAYETALACAGVMLVPLLHDAVESMKAAGVSKGEADSILEKQLMRTGRAYLRSGKRAPGLSDDDRC